jgi:ligand-binding sensor domain-containing protein/signal transduction histidine kinase
MKYRRGIFRQARFAGLLLVAAAAFASFADVPPVPVSQYISRLWQKDDGLPHGSIEAVTQTSDGYLWVATRRGLARFNGAEFKVFDAEHTPALKHSHITGLLAGDDSELWAGTSQGGLARLSRGVFTPCELPPGNSNGLVRSLTRGAGGGIWFATAASLFKVSDGKVSAVSGPALPGDMRVLCRDGGEGLWVGTASHGIYHWVDGKVTAAYSVTNGLPHNSVRSICLDSHGTLWVGTMLGVCGLKADGKFVYYDTLSGLSDRIVTALYEDRAGNIWIGAYGGLHRLTGGKLYSEVTEAGASYASISSIYEDAEGNIWVGTNEGLYQLRPRKFTVYSTREGLSHNNVTSVMEDRDGAIWAGTWGGGVSRICDGRIQAFSRRAGFGRDLLLTLFQDHAGSMWTGMDLGGGLVQFVVDGDKARLKPAGLSGTIRVVLEDSETNLWVGTSTGLIRLPGKPPRRFGVRDGLADDAVRSLALGGPGVLWVGTGKGLSCIKDGKVTAFPGQSDVPASVVSGIHIDGEGTLWLATDQGLVRLKDGSARRYTSREGLFEDELYAVLEDDERRLWFSSQQGVFCLPRASIEAFDRANNRLRCIAFDKHDGLLSLQCSGVGQPAACRSRDGRLWFATIRGVAVVSPAESYRPNERVPPVYIEEVFCDKHGNPKSGAAPGNGSALPASLASSPCVFPPGEGELEFRYAALSFAVPEKNRFQYQLRGVDSDWVDAGSRRTAFYNNVAPGRYTFRVRASNNDGVWNEQGAAVDVTLRPHFYQTAWFQALAVAGLLGAVAGTVTYFDRRKARQQMRRLEVERARESERARIARDIHDELGARLTKISKLTERAGRLNPPDSPAVEAVRDIQGTAQEMLAQLDETVWVVNPRNDRLDRLSDYILSYAEEFCRQAGLRCRMKVVGEAPPLPVAAESRHHLFLAFKEALNNAVRHSAAREVQVILEFANGVLSATVRDDGRGFDPGVALARGRGLDNMRSRMGQIHGTLEIESRAGAGTTVRIVYPAGTLDGGEA